MQTKTKIKDIEILNNFIDNYSSKFKSVKYICLISPSYEQYLVFRKFFPNSKIICSSIKSWNLNKSITSRFDLIYAANVFMYSNDPILWFNNVFKSCKNFIIQDITTIKRKAI